MKKNIKKQFWFSRLEAQELQRKAKKACLSEAVVVRKLVTDKPIKERPDDRFYKYLNTLKDISDSLTIIANNSDKCKNLDTDLIMKEVNENRKFRLLMMKEYLAPEEYI